MTGKDQGGLSSPLVRNKSDTITKSVFSKTFGHKRGVDPAENVHKVTIWKENDIISTKIKT